MKKAIVTGAAGFLGKYCSRELAQQGYQVTGMDIVPFNDSKEWGLTSYYNKACSLQELVSISNITGLPDVIIHCAGSGSVPLSYQNPHQDFLANVVTSLEVLEFCRLHSSEIHLVVPSSAAVYGVVDKMPITETTPLKPVSPYGFHKKIIEDLTYSYSSNFKVKTCLVRLFSLYGPGLRKQILWDACEKATADSFNFSGQGEERRDFLHVTDAAKLLVLAAHNASEKCHRVNGGTGIGSTIKEILEVIGSCWAPPKKPLFSNTTRLGDPAHYIADTELLKAWGYKPQKNLFEEISNYVEWYKQAK